MNLTHWLLIFFMLLQPCFTTEPPYEHAISRDIWDKCEQFIQSQAKAFFLAGHTHIPAETTQFCPLEYDPSNGNIFIHLKETQGGYLGKGGHKFVSKSILYGDHSKLVARCESDHTAEKEASILNDLLDKRGVIQLISFIPRAGDKGDLIVQYCNGGSIKSLIQANWKVQDDELLLIMYDLASGLKSLHDLDFLHRDLHPRNILLHREKGQIRAFINDLGNARKISSELLPNPDRVPGCRRSPEALLQGTMSIDPKKSEAYLLGLSLYIVLFHKNPPWIDVFDHSDIWDYTPSKRIEFFKKVQKAYKKTLKKYLQETREGIAKDAAIIVFKLLQPDPSQRIYLDTAQSEIKAAAKKWNQDILTN